MARGGPRGATTHTQQGLKANARRQRPSSSNKCQNRSFREALEPDSGKTAAPNCSNKKETSSAGPRPRQHEKKHEAEIQRNLKTGQLKAVWRHFLGCHDMALELVRGAGFSWKLMCGAGPGDLGGVRGVGFGWKSQEDRPENLQPDCLQVPSK